MFRGIGGLFNSLSLFMPPWVIGILVVGLLVWILPGWLSNIKIKQIGTRVRRMVRASGPDRQRLLDEAMALAGDDSLRLGAVFDDAVRYDLPAVRDVVLARLRELGRPEEVRRLEAKLVPESERRRPRQGHPLELAVVVERLLAEGRPDAARARLEEALARFPDDPDLLALRDRLAQSTPAE